MVALKIYGLGLLAVLGEATALATTRTHEINPRARNGCVDSILQRMHRRGIEIGGESRVAARGDESKTVFVNQEDALPVKLGQLGATLDLKPCIGIGVVDRKASGTQMAGIIGHQLQALDSAWEKFEALYKEANIEDPDGLIVLPDPKSLQESFGHFQGYEEIIKAAEDGNKDLLEKMKGLVGAEKMREPVYHSVEDPYYILINEEGKMTSGEQQGLSTAIRKRINEAK